MAESNEIETPELTYMERQRLQVIETAKKKRDSIREEVGEKLKEHLPKEVIPRYLRRAIWSKDKLKIAKAIRKALADGWTKAEMLRQVRLISEHNQQAKEYETENVNE